VWAADSSRIRLSSLSRVGTGAAAAVALVVLAFASGGYPPADHGMLILAFALVVLVVSLVADVVPLDRRSLLFVGGLAGLALWELASVAWAAAAAWPVLEAERGLLYAVAGGALVLVVTRGRVVALVAGIVAGTTLVALYALATRLYPGHVGGVYDPSGGYQLAAPIGYWNALGLLLAFGLLLGAGLAVHGSARGRLLAGAALVPLGVALYFTFSRGAMLALVVGLVVLVVLERRSAVGFAFLALAPAAGILLTSRASALTKAGEPLEVAQAQGQRLAWQLAFLACLGAFATWTLHRLGERVRIPLPGGRAVAVAALIVLSAVAVAALAREGGPDAVANRALQAFRQEPPPAEGALDRRLLSVSGHGRADYWRVAARMVEREPLLGEGAGGFERRWMEERSASNNARDAHNLYLETLAELGPIGLALLLIALLVPLAGLRSTRHGALVPAAAAAYAAFLVHAAVDWDWELPVLVLPALGCGAILLAEARTSAPVRLTAPYRALGVSAAALAIAVAIVANVGNRALAESVMALEQGDTRRAAEAARQAQAWAPWSHEPWQLLGEAQLAAGHDAEARRSLAQAIRRAPEEWRLWFDLAIVSDAPQARVAITRASELNPLGDEVRDLERR
jgi:tetratricopeptide (TPR) repeat protein